MEWKTLLPFFSLAALLTGGLTIREYARHPPRRTVIFICKPLSTILILAVAALPGTLLRNPYASAVGIGLLFSIFGDIWEMFPRRHFLKALACFLVTHVCYAAAFLTDMPESGSWWPLLPFGVFSAAFWTYLRPGLSPVMKAAVGVYAAVIAVMAGLAVRRLAAGFSIGALCAAAGALLFLASDAALAVNRFRRPLRNAQTVILSSYFAGQWLIALSVGLRDM
jgi:uncharacterized membrane protein YhhN